VTPLADCADLTAALPIPLEEELDAQSRP
jgi:hypothetical protein